MIEQNEQDMQQTVSSAEIESVRVPEEKIKQYMEDRAKLIAEIKPNEFDKDIELDAVEKVVDYKLAKLR